MVPTMKSEYAKQRKAQIVKEYSPPERIERPKIRHAIKYTCTCVQCGEVTEASRKKTFCDADCRTTFNRLHKKAEREALKKAAAEAAPVISEEVRRLQRKQMADQAARKLKEEIQAMALPFSALSQSELEAHRALCREKVMQGRSKVHAFHVGFGPNV